MAFQQVRELVIVLLPGGCHEASELGGGCGAGSFFEGLFHGVGQGVSEHGVKASVLATGARGADEFLGEDD